MSAHELLVMLLHPGLNHLDGSIDVALVEGDLEVVPWLGYLNRTSFPFFFSNILRYRVAGSLSACGLLLSSFLIYTQVCNLAIVPLNVLHTLMFEFFDLTV